MLQRKNRQDELPDTSKTDSKKKEGKLVIKKKRKKRLFSFTGLDGKYYRLTAKQKLFCDWFLKTLNGVQSALKVYETTDYKAASVIASENLDKLNIIAYLSKEFARFEITPEETMAHLGYLTRQCRDLSAKGRGIDMSLKVFGKYAAEKVELGVDKRMTEFLDRVAKRFPK